MDVIEALEALSALSNETRLWVFRLLVQAGHDGMTAGEIADHLSSRQNTMSRASITSIYREYSIYGNKSKP